MAHEERAHALLSASSAHRWLYCTPSAKLEEQFPDTTSEAAKEGTLAHELAELKVRNYFYPADISKRKLNASIKKLKEQELWQDEMTGYTDEYLDYIKATALSLPATPYVAVEKRVDFGMYVPDGFGTADCILICGNVLHVIDLKYGKGVPVSAEGNPQLTLYALGAYETYKLLYSIEEIKMSIVQPRLDNISEWGCSLKEMLAFGEYVKKKAQLAIKGEGDFLPSKTTCQFCRAKGRCRARADENVRLAFFTDKKPPLISNAEVGDYLQKGEDVDKWLKDLKEYALKECLAGKEVPGWKAVEGRGQRDWTDMDKAFETLMEHGIPEALLYEKKPLTLSQVEKEVGKKEFIQYVGNLVAKSPGKPALVKESDKREAITNVISAKDAFKEEKIEMENLTNVTTGKVRLSYVHLFKPYAHMQGQEEKFTCTVLVPKSDVDTMNRIHAAIEAAKQKGISDKWNGTCPPIVPTPVYDGDGVRPSDGMAFGPECKGHYVFTASTKADRPVEVVDRMGNPIINQSEVYSGMYGRVNVTFYPYSFGGKKGIGCGLGPVQKLEDGESLGGGAVSAAQAFGSPQPAQQGFHNAPQGMPAQPAGFAGTGGVNPITGMPY